MFRRLLTPTFLIFCAFILGGMVFKSTAPIQCGTILPNDSIFVLTGDERRIPFAMRKMREFPNADLYIIGAGAQGNIEVARPAIIESKSKIHISKRTRNPWHRQKTRFKTPGNNHDRRSHEPCKIFGTIRIAGHRNNRMSRHFNGHAPGKKTWKMDHRIYKIHRNNVGNQRKLKPKERKNVQNYIIQNHPWHIFHTVVTVAVNRPGIQ